MADAGIDRPGRRAFRPGQVPAADRAAHRRSGGARRDAWRPRDTLKSMGLSRAASALGVAVALGEIDRATRRRARSASDWELWSGRASCSAGIELLGSRDRRARHVAEVDRAARHRSRGDGGCDRHRAGARRARPARPCDRRPIAAERNAGGSSPCWPRPRQATTAACAATGTPCWTIPTFRRPAMPAPSSAARLAGLVGHAEIYVSGGAEHQGPDGGGPVALIVDRGMA